MIYMDYLFYGSLVFIPFNFLHFNIIQSISLFYGINSWHWYISQGLPIILTTFILFIIIGINSSRKKPHDWQHIKPLLQLIAWVIMGYSLLGHKEFRFLYPLLSIFIIIAGYGLKELQESSEDSNNDNDDNSNHNNNNFISQRYLKFSIIFLIVTNLPLIYYANTVHQKGVVEVMDYLRKEVDNKKVQDIGFMMPCHSTPFYSNLHRNVTMWFLTCEPPLK